MSFFFHQVIFFLITYCSFFFFLKKYIFYCVLGFGVHVNNMQDCHIGIYMAMWFAAFLPITYIWHFSPCYPSPIPHPPTVRPLVPPDRTQCVMLPSMCPCILIVEHPPMSENMWCLIFLFLCHFSENDGFQSLQRTRTHCFLWVHSILWCICAIFSLYSLSSMGIWVGAKSLLL